LIKTYEAYETKPLIKKFYEQGWRTVKETRKIFEALGIKLTEYLFNNDEIFDSITSNEKINVYSGPIARAGCGLFRQSTKNLIKKRLEKCEASFQVIGLGLNRLKNPEFMSAEVYWNTLRNKIIDSNQFNYFIIYDFGEATGSTIEGVIEDFRNCGISSKNIIFCLGAACIEQTKNRLESITSEITLIVGSKWKYKVTDGEDKYYLDQMFDGEWIDFIPRDWGKCVSGITNESSINAFISWIKETMDISKEDEKMLFQRWKQKYLKKNNPN
jgi:hypothetical protein